MAHITMEKWEERPVLPADSILLLKVQEISLRERTGQNGNTFTKLEFKFKILDIQNTGDGSPKEDYEALISTSVFGSVPFRLNDSPENKLKQWTEAILGMELAVGFDLDTDLLEGKTVRGVTSTYDKRTTNPVTGKPFKGVQVDSLLPVGGGAAAQRPLSAWDAPPTPAATAAASTPVAAPTGSGFGGFTDDPPF